MEWLDCAAKGADHIASDAKRRPDLKCGAICKQWARRILYGVVQLARSVSSCARHRWWRPSAPKMLPGFTHGARPPSVPVACRLPASCCYWVAGLYVYISAVSSGYQPSHVPSCSVPRFEVVIRPVRSRELYTVTQPR